MELFDFESPAALRRPDQYQLLGGLAEAARRLLVTSDFEAAVNGALEAIATAAGVNRIFIYQHHIEQKTQREFATCPYEWTAENTVMASELPCQFPMFYDEIEGYGEWLSELKAGRPVQKLARDMSVLGQEKQFRAQALSVLTVPIVIQGDYWGSFGFDDCTQERVWSDAEIAVLESAAASFAGALEKQSSMAELKRRDAWLKSVNAAAQCLFAMDVLEAIPEALMILGKGMKQDRVYVFENVFPNGPKEVFWSVAYEWVKAGILFSTEIANTEWPIPMEAFPSNLNVPFLSGQSVQFLTRDLDGKARQIKEDGQTLSLIAVPIIVAGQWWGVLGGDDCAVEREWSDAEIAVLETAAACIGNAIERDRTRKEREAGAQSRAVELGTHNLELANRDRILEATAESANVLLTDEDFEGAFNRALQIIGEAVGTDRVGIAQHLVDLSENQPGQWRVIYEWHVPEMMPVAQLSYPEPMQGTYAGAETLYAMHQRGEGFSITTAQMMEPFRSSMTFMNVQTLHAVPIILRNSYWGTVVFGDCRQQRQRSPAELAALQTIADCIGNAIERDRSRKAREAAERTALIERERATRAVELEAANQVLMTRDRWLETTAAAANQLLSTADITVSVNTALQTIGTNLKSDRLGVMRHVSDASELGCFQILYEWGAAGTAAQIDNQELHQMPASDFAAWTRQLMMGQPVGGPVAEQPEPFRSKMRSLDTLSTYAVPIFIETEFWGVMFMDYCCELRQLAPAELAVFNTAATCIGSAIHREQMRRDREQAELDTRLQQEREQAAQSRAATLETYNRQLQQRDQLLNSVNAAAQCLVANEDLGEALPTMLRILGEGTNQCRAYILRNSQDENTGELLFNLMLEWDAPKIPSKMEAGAHFPVPIDRFPDYLTAPLKAGRVTQFLARELDGLSPAERQPGQALSLVGVPIICRGEWWGLLGLDDCIEERVWSEAEIAVLETAAAAVGGALERDRSRQDRELAERTALIERERAARADELEAANQILQTRDRWLETTTTAVNVLLSGADVSAGVNAALRTLGENLECDRVFVMQRITTPNAPAGDLGVARLTYEWFSEGLEPHIDIPHIAEFPGEKFRDSIQQLLTGQWIGGIVEELPDPMRSYQQSLGVKSLYTVPVFIKGEAWGVVGINHCHQAKRLSPEEISVFQTAATCIGSAIYQETMRRDQAAQERAYLLSRVAEAANLLLRSADYMVVFPEVVRLLGEAVGSDRCGILKDVKNSNSGPLAIELLTEWQRGEIPSTNLASPNCLAAGFPLDGEFWDFHQLFLRGEVVNRLVSDLSGPVRNFFEDQGNTSVLIVPIMVQGECWGKIGFDNCGEPRLYDEAEISILRVAAESIAAAIARQTQDEALRRSEQAILQEREKAAQTRAKELAKTNEAIAQTLDVLTTTPELNEFLGQILTQIVEQIGADDTHLFLYDAETHTLRSQLVVQNNTVYLGTAPGDPDIFSTPIPADITPGWEMIVNARKPLTLDQEHSQTADLMWPTTIEWHTSRGHQSVTCACMKIGDQPIGFIGFAFCDRKVLTNEQLEFIQALTNQATLAIHLTRLAEQARTTALTDERNRLAREIHDTLAQAFTGISLQLEAAKGILNQNPDRAQTYLRQARDLARQGLSEARRSVQALRSQALEAASLSEALHKTLVDMTQGTSIQPRFHQIGDPRSLSEEIQLNLLRIGQEAITNVLRHAQAQTLTITLTFDLNQIQLYIVDDGVGFAPQLDSSLIGFGLIGIRERTARCNGYFQLTSQVGQGTQLKVTLPL